MKEWLKDKEIENEYGEKVSHKEFWDMVKEKQVKGNRNPAEYAKIYCPDSLRDFTIDGYSFSDVEFS